MVLNKQVSSNINQWHVDYDQNGFLIDENWLNASELNEDILQLSHVYGEGPILDVGYYKDRFKIYIIYNENWENPKEIFESQDPSLVSKKVYEFIDKYASG